MKMRALLDTNIVIHRENTKATSYSIGKLFYWLDKLHYEKLIHPYTVSELRKYRNPQMQDLYDAKLDAYGQMKSVAPQSEQFKHNHLDFCTYEFEKIRGFLHLIYQFHRRFCFYRAN